jgi:hypothetical protein
MRICDPNGKYGRPGNREFRVRDEFGNELKFTELLDETAT